MIGLRWGVATDAGSVRESNEDNYVAQQGLFAVADGMGGHVFGEVAAEVAVETLRKGDYEGLVEGLRAANRAIWQRARDNAELRGMGTTMCAIALVTDAEGNEVLQVANVGDSRAYRFRQGELEQLTEDHNLVEELLREGRITAEEARVHPQRNIVTRTLGIEPDVEVDCKIVDPYEGDRYLICSDGLFDMVEDPAIAHVLRAEKDVQVAADELVRIANDAGGRDNITVVLVEVVDDGGKAESASALLASDPGATRARPIATAGTGDRGITESIPVSRGGRRAERRAERGGRRFTWRVALFTLVLLAILGGAVYATWWFGRSTYYVGERDEEVAIYRGRPGGVLWLDPTLEEETGLALDDVPQADRPEIRDGRQFSTLAKARAFVERLEENAAVDERATGSTPNTIVVGGPGATSTSTSTSTTAPTP